MASSSATKEFGIKELDLNSMIKPADDTTPDSGGSKIMIVGRPHTGKSQLIKTILHAKRDIIPVAQVHSGTEDSTGFFSSFMPPVFVYDELNTGAVEKLLFRQKSARKYLVNPWSALVVDDCAADMKELNSPLFQRVFKNGRHYAMLTIMSVQYAMDVTPKLRAAIDGTFLMRETNPQVRKKLYENYASCVDGMSSAEDFNTMLDDVCTDYTALFINNRCQTGKLEDTFFWYKPDMTALEDFRFGSDLAWGFSDIMLDPNRDDADMQV
jgi:hypothetical protein